MSVQFNADVYFKNRRPWVDIIAYGADPTGGADSTTAIQNAINAVNSAGGGIVYCPPGIYLISSGPIMLPDHITLLGPLMHRGEWWALTGKGAVFKDNTNGNTISALGTGNASLASSIQGLGFESSVSSGIFVLLQAGANDILIRNCSFQNKGNAIATSATNASIYDIAIEDCFFQAQSAASVGIGTSGGPSWRITGNYFRAGNTQAILDNGTVGQSALTIQRNIFTGYTSVGIAVIDLSTNAVRNADIGFNYFEGNNGSSSWQIILKADSAHIHDNFFDTGVRGIEVLAGSSNVHVNDNRFSTFTAGLIYDVPVSSWNNTLVGVTTPFSFGTNVSNPGLVEKTGSGTSNYTTSSTSYVDVDATNLVYAVAVPTRWTLRCIARANISTGTSTTTAGLALADGTTVLKESFNDFDTSGIRQEFGVAHQLAGDGNVHTIKLQWKAVNGQTITMTNSSASTVPAMEFLLMPPN